MSAIDFFVGYICYPQLLQSDQKIQFSVAALWFEMLHETHLVLCWDEVKFSLILNTFFQPSIMFSSHVKNINLAILSRLVSRVFPQIIQLDDLQRDRVLVWNCGYIFIYLIFASPEKANKKTETESFVIRLSVGSTSTPVHVNNTVLSALSNGRFQIN